jgi:hypothetical protein
MYPLLLGAFLNAAAILLHGGMPVDPVALDKAGLSAYRDFLLDRKDGLHYLGPAFPLGDRIPLPGRTVSPGDLAITLGLFRSLSHSRLGRKEDRPCAKNTCLKWLKNWQERVNWKD